ncbi:hypothetical protein PP175_26930 (plasmid) [Aneurinibacillus sp. Ricciae_BoGa-3]|uniref:OmpL47-type beta-barrel domain-containing protein n=1 Tax=Aneurinibacillus sp. Ricciae_BoGa-3 TaxID=3022697 RepID=UPI0023409DD9|nr:hypothetical protein [Aneurinibacillus sp. Ricciae_BoGa-3]WCK57673.1 hypothetical protein PP175_26930 [Aneurinibacillus sp. Ricciae_BoGa-3]
MANTLFTSAFPQEAFASTSVVKTQNISFPSNTQQNRNQTLRIPNLKNVQSITSDNGNASYSINGNQLTVNVSNGNGTVIQTGGSYTPSDTKYVTGKSSSYYADGQGYWGYLTSYLVSGSYTPGASKYVSGQNSSYYSDWQGYSGSLSSYVYSGSDTPAGVKWVTGMSSANYSDSYGYSGTLSQYVESGSYTPAQTKYVTGQSYSYYYDYQGYSGLLTPYVVSGSQTPADSKQVTDSRTGKTGTLPSSISYNSGGYSGTLYPSGSATVISGSYENVSTQAFDVYGAPNQRAHRLADAGCPSQLYVTRSDYYYHYAGYIPVSGYMNDRDYGGMVCTYVGRIPALNADTRVWQQSYSGTVTKPASDTRVYNYAGYVTKPAIDTRVYRYQGYVSRPEIDSRVYRYAGYVSQPGIDTRVWNYQGYVTKPAVDTRTYETRYAYNVTIKYVVFPSEPNVSLNVADNTWVGQDVVATISNDASDNNTVEYKFSGATNQDWTTYTSPISVSNEGITNLSARAVNADGSMSDEVTKTIKVDKSLPNLSITPSTTNWTNGNINLSINGTDAFSGVSKIQLWNGGWVNASSASFIITQNGTYDFAVFDNVGNKATKSITVSNIDRTAPTLTFTPNTTSWTNSNVSIEVSASDDASGVKQIKMPNGSLVSGNSASYDVGSNGTYTFIVVDNAGNQTSKSITVSNVDTTSPTSPSISNNTNWTTQSSVPVSIVGGTDNQSGINHTEYKIEGATNQGYTTYFQPFSILNEGQTKIIARTLDNAGNVSSETISYVRIDRSAPVNTSITIQLKP